MAKNGLYRIENIDYYTVVTLTEVNCPENLRDFKRLEFQTFQKSEIPQGHFDQLLREATVPY